MWEDIYRHYTRPSEKPVWMGGRVLTLKLGWGGREGGGGLGQCNTRPTADSESSGGTNMN